MAPENYTGCPLPEEYLNCLTVIKGRLPNTVVEYRTGLWMFFAFLTAEKNRPDTDQYDPGFADQALIQSMTLRDMYTFISHRQNDRLVTT